MFIRHLLYARNSKYSHVFLQVQVLFSIYKKNTTESQLLTLRPSSHSTLWCVFNPTLIVNITEANTKGLICVAFESLLSAPNEYSTYFSLPSLPTRKL